MIITSLKKLAQKGVDFYRIPKYHIGRRFYMAVKKHMEATHDHPMYETYMEFALSTNLRGKRVAEKIKNYAAIRGKRFLDIGCAYGGFNIAFAKEGAEAVGIDKNTGLLKLAFENYKDHNLEPRLYQKDITIIESVKDLGTFDIITCNDVIEHVADVNQTIQNIAALLNEHGLLYMENPNGASVAEVIRDGHYGLFGITLLSRENAMSYYHECGFEAEYDVGHLLKLQEYVDLLKKNNIYLSADEIVNSFLYPEARISNLKESLRSVITRLEEFKREEKYSSRTRELVTDHVTSFVNEVNSKIKAYENEEDRHLKEELGRRILKEHEIEFWEVIGIKNTHHRVF